MKLKAAMKNIDEGWIRRRKGYRISFERRVGDDWVSECFPEEMEKPLSSDVSAWELARRFAQANRPDGPELEEGAVVNISVVDDLGHPVNFYGTNKHRVLNKREA
jgi:hypothetical protein